MTSADVQATFCATLVDEWQRCGLRDAVVSPGSRSTPLALALVRTAPPITVHVVLDERSASFVALGLALATGRPTLLLMTSGTAPAHAHPAIIEAGLARVPLLVCTADRPPELHGIGAAQTVDQTRLFGAAVRWFHDPGPPSAATATSWRSLASRAYSEAVGSPAGPGPVQLNLAFREPLVGTAGVLPEARSGGGAWHVHTAVGDRGALNRGVGDDLVSGLQGRRGVIVAGGGAGAPELVHGLAGQLGWPVLADNRSGCRVPAATTVAAADAIVRSPRIAQLLQPEVTLRLGSPFASKVVAEWLQQTHDDVLVDPHWAWNDPQRRAGLVLTDDPVSVCRALQASGVAGADPGWLDLWNRAEAAAQTVLDGLAGIGGEGVSEPAVARLLLGALPHGAQLVVSSSMPVRDLEWYGGPRDGVRVYSNRGANGIDGLISTLLGVAAAGAGPAFALTGDLAFLHDIGGLVTARAMRSTATIVVIDNGGGGIFEFLPQSRLVEREMFEKLFGTPQNVDLAAAASGLGADVHRVNSVDGLMAAIAREAAREAGFGVIVVAGDRGRNLAVHAEIHDRVRQAVEAAVGLPAGPL